ncbi:hypothetical protein [Nonomuraea jabiensis]|uniref:hypothetical protein n=1 Tax=Nonomuraea jabiensis TaxID=882448 RepID=UPI003D7331F8
MVALVVAVAVATMGMAIGELPVEVTESATLMVMGLVGTALLRDRARSSWQLERLEELIHEASPRLRRRSATSEDDSLEQRFNYLADRLEDTFQELEELENAMRARAAVARRLAAEAESNRRDAETSREVAERRQEEAKAFDLLLQSKIDDVAARVEERGKGTQRRYMLYGVILGAAAAVLLDAGRKQMAGLSSPQMVATIYDLRIGRGTEASSRWSPCHPAGHC